MQIQRRQRDATQALEMDRSIGLPDWIGQVGPVWGLVLRSFPHKTRYAGWPWFVPGRFLMRLGFSGRFGSQVKFGLPVRAVRRFTRFAQWQKSARDTKTEMITKLVAMGAVNFSIGTFCTEFRCEQLRDNDIFEIGVGKPHRALELYRGGGGNVCTETLF